ncbi:MAG: hypothetical protein KGH94_01220 [Candidatus Micrarchaeota archaeon]|nr:hypothetical protein [Candidatus Micrarchaeota archaeon]
MNKGWIVWIALVIVVAVIVYLYTGFKFLNTAPKTTTSIVTTTKASTTVAYTTSVQPHLDNCSNLFVPGGVAYSSTNVTCHWSGGILGIWVQAGKAYNTTFTILGANGKTYLKGPFSYNNVTFYSNVTLPAQNYTVSLAVGPETGTGGNPFVKLNLTTVLPHIVYSGVYNANFSNGKYTGWNVSGSGFGEGPLNITYADSNTVNCYFGSPWSNYPGTYFATTYTCGISVAPGNLTSEEFRVNPKEPFLNFRMVSPDDSLIYVEVFQVNGNAVVLGHFNTYNISVGPNVSSTFANVSLPLTTLANKVVRIKIVAATVQPQRYMAIGDFSLANLPHSDTGVVSQVNITRGN